jgi:apolipoprotein N-acyltransferase
LTRSLQAQAQAKPKKPAIFFVMTGILLGFAWVYWGQVSQHAVPKIDWAMGGFVIFLLAALISLCAGLGKAFE